MTDKELIDLSLAADDYVREHFAKATKESSAGEKEGEIGGLEPASRKTQAQQMSPDTATPRAAGPDTEWADLWTKKPAAAGPNAAPTPRVWTAWTCTHAAEHPWRCPDCLIRELADTERVRQQWQDACSENLAAWALAKEQLADTITARDTWQRQYEERDEELGIARRQSEVIDQLCAQRFHEIYTLTEQLAEAKAGAIAWERKTVEAERWQSIAESKLEAAERLAEFGVRPDVHALAVRRAEAAMFERVKHQCAALAYSYSVGCSNKILHLTE